MSAQYFPDIRDLLAMNVEGLFFYPNRGDLMSVKKTWMIILLFQAILLAQGGLTTIDVHTFSMAVAGPLMVCTLFKFVKKADGQQWQTVASSAYDIDRNLIYCDKADLMEQGKGMLAAPGAGKPADYVVKSGKALRFGYTTGSCAAAASKAAATMLMDQRLMKEVLLTLPDGKTLCLPVNDAELQDHEASCCIVKDAGDDPDVTHGIKIYAKVRKTAGGSRSKAEPASAE